MFGPGKPRCSVCGRKMLLSPSEKGYRAAVHAGQAEFYCRCGASASYQLKAGAWQRRKAAP